ncbi:MAG: hypothetical protein GIW97_08970 [Candidatus Eremiobacteraeota bacterium]|nr:hypothetical protein [Candidatus Eremiobacteraeota bacterium]
MKSIRTFLIPAGLIAALALPGASFAQVNAPQAPPAGAQHGARHHGGFMRALQGLNLSADQQSRIKALVAQFHQAHPKGSPRDPQAAKALHDQVLGILTPAQQAQLKANKKAARGNEAGEGAGEKPNGAEAGEAPGGAEHGGRMMQRFAALNLSAQQQTQIQSLIAQFRQAHPQGSPRDPQAMQTLRSQINAVLTPAQQQQLKGMEQNRDGGGR